MSDKLDGELEPKQDATGPQQDTEKPRKPGAFVPGDPRINRTRGPQGKKRKPSGLLADMRAVYEQDESEDRGPAQKALRKMFNENIDKFIARLGRLEQAYQAEAPKEEKEEPAEAPDKVTPKLITLLEDQIRGFEEKRAREDAEFAKRPDAAMMGATLQQKLTSSLEREEMLRKEVAELRRRACPSEK
jgi:hypothetical protein